MNKEKLKYFLEITALFVVYYVTGSFGLKLDAISGFASSVWPPTGISIAALLIFGRKLWPAVFLGALAVNFSIGGTFLTAAGIAIGNTGEAVVAAFLLNQIGFRRNLDRVQDVLSFVIIGAVLSTAVSALIGTSFVKLAGGREDFFQIFKIWWFGDFLSALILAPLLLVLSHAPGKIFFRKYWLVESISLFSGLIFVCWLIFFYPNILENGSFTLIYLTFPFLVWGALSFGQHGVVIISFIITFINVLGSSLHGGLFKQGNVTENVFLMESYRCVLSITGLILAAVILEREKVKDDLLHAYDDLEKRVQYRTKELHDLNLEKTELVEKLELAVRTRNEFFSIASHELKNPITSMKLQIQMSEILLKQMEESPLRGQVEKLLELSIHKIDQMTKLIYDMLDISRIVTGKFKLEKTEFSMNKLVAQVLGHFSAELNISGSSINFETEGDVIGSWDHFRMEQVITNLISNAIKYGEGKTIDVKVHKNGVSSVSISIKDNGIGIAQEDQQRIFGQFERWQTGKNYTGFGLGLYIVSKILEEHGGTIFVESMVGKGAKFTVILPLQHSPS